MLVERVDNSSFKARRAATKTYVLRLVRGIQRSGAKHKHAALYEVELDTANKSRYVGG